MKKITLFFVVCILFVFLSSTSFAQDYIRVGLDGNLIEFDQQPIVKDGRTLVPIRAIFEAMGAIVEWNSDTKTVVATLANTTLSIQIDSNIMKKNTEEIRLDVAAQNVGGRVLVPVRAIAEGFGAMVQWDAKSQTVIIFNKVAFQNYSNKSIWKDGIGGLILLPKTNEFDGMNLYFPDAKNIKLTISELSPSINLNFELNFNKYEKDFQPNISYASSLLQFSQIEYEPDKRDKEIEELLSSFRNALISQGFLLCYSEEVKSTFAGTDEIFTTQKQFFGKGEVEIILSQGYLGNNISVKTGIMRKHWDIIRFSGLS